MFSFTPAKQRSDKTFKIFYGNDDFDFEMCTKRLKGPFFCGT